MPEPLATRFLRELFMIPGLPFSGSPPSQNQARNHKENRGGILTNEGSNTSTQLQVSPPENPQNHAQNIESGDSGDSGGTLPTLEDGMYNNDGNKNIFSKRYVNPQSPNIPPRLVLDI